MNLIIENNSQIISNNVFTKILNRVKNKHVNFDIVS